MPAVSCTRTQGASSITSNRPRPGHRAQPGDRRATSGSASQAQSSPSESNVAALIEDLQAERIDVAIIRQTSQESERVKVEALFDEDMVIVLPPQHRLAGRMGIVCTHWLKRR